MSDSSQGSSEVTTDDLARVFANPFYCIKIHPDLVLPHPPMVTKEDWVKAAENSVRELGVKKFLENMLEVLEDGDVPMGYKQKELSDIDVTQSEKREKEMTEIVDAMSVAIQESKVAGNSEDSIENLCVCVSVIAYNFMLKTKEEYEKKLKEKDEEIKGNEKTIESMDNLMRNNSLR